jgi:hypothetical protein
LWNRFSHRQLGLFLHQIIMKSSGHFVGRSLGYQGIRTHLNVSSWYDIPDLFWPDKGKCGWLGRYNRGWVLHIHHIRDLSDISIPFGRERSMLNRGIRSACLENVSNLAVPWLYPVGKNGCSVLRFYFYHRTYWFGLKWRWWTDGLICKLRISTTCCGADAAIGYLFVVALLGSEKVVCDFKFAQNKDFQSVQKNEP